MGKAVQHQGDNGWSLIQWNVKVVEEIYYKVRESPSAAGVLALLLFLPVIMLVGKELGRSMLPARMSSMASDTGPLQRRLSIGVGVVEEFTVEVRRELRVCRGCPAAPRKGN